MVRYRGADYGGSYYITDDGRKVYTSGPAHYGDVATQRQVVPATYGDTVTVDNPQPYDRDRSGGLSGGTIHPEGYDVPPEERARKEQEYTDWVQKMEQLIHDPNMVAGAFAGLAFFGLYWGANNPNAVAAMLRAVAAGVSQTAEVTSGAIPL